MIMSGDIINYYILEGITLSECLMIKLISFFCRCSEEFHYEQQPANFTSWKRPYHQQKLHSKTKNMGQFWGCSWVKKLWRSYIPVIWISANPRKKTEGENNTTSSLCLILLHTWVWCKSTSFFVKSIDNQTHTYYQMTVQVHVFYRIRKKKLETNLYRSLN